METMCALIEIRSLEAEGEHIKLKPSPYHAVISSRRIRNSMIPSLDVEANLQAVERCKTGVIISNNNGRHVESYSNLWGSSTICSLDYWSGSTLPFRCYCIQLTWYLFLLGDILKTRLAPLSHTRRSATEAC